MAPQAILACPGREGPRRDTQDILGGLHLQVEGSFESTSPFYSLMLVNFEVISMALPILILSQWCRVLNQRYSLNLSKVSPACGPPVDPAATRVATLTLAPRHKGYPGARHRPGPPAVAPPLGPPSHR